MGAGLPQTFQTPLSDVSTVQRDALGSLRLEGGKWYKYLKLNNTATVAGVAGDKVVYFAATGYSANRCCTRGADGDATMPIAAGVLVAAVAGVAATDYFLWVQIKGRAILSNAVAAGVAGQAFKPTAANATFTIAALVTDNVAGIGINATTDVYLDCPW